MPESSTSTKSGSEHASATYGSTAAGLAYLSGNPAAHAFKTIEDLLRIPLDRREAAAAALSAWLISPHTTLPKPRWWQFTMHFWLGAALPRFYWMDDGKAAVEVRQSSADVAQDAKLAARIEQRICDGLNAAMAPGGLLDELTPEAGARRGIEHLVRQYGLHVTADQDGERIYRASTKVGAPPEDGAEIETRVPVTQSSQQEWEHLKAWLIAEDRKLETIHAMRRRLSADHKMYVLSHGEMGGMDHAWQYLRTAGGEHLPLRSRSEFGALTEALRLVQDPEKLAAAIAKKQQAGKEPELGTEAFAKARHHPWYADPAAVRALQSENAVLKGQIADMEKATGLFVVDGTGGKLPLQVMRDLLAIQGSTGNWDWSEYLLGMYNGMELFLSIMENRPPAYRSAPETGWMNQEPFMHSFVLTAAEEAAVRARGGDPAKVIGLTNNHLSVTHQMRCTVEWPVNPGLIFRVGETIELLGADFDARQATLATVPKTTVLLTELLAHAEKMTPEEAQKAARKKGESTPNTNGPDGPGISASTAAIISDNYVQGVSGYRVASSGPIVDTIAVSADELAIRQGEGVSDLRLDNKPLSSFSTTPNPETVRMLADMHGDQVPANHDAVSGTFPGEWNGETKAAPASESPLQPSAVVEPPADTKGHEAMQALEKANPDAPGLVGKDAPRSLVFLHEILGQFARFAVSQSPYLHPDGLLEVLDAIKGDIQDRFHPTLGWAELNMRDVEAMLNEAIMALPQVSVWNQRRNGNASEYAFTSRREGKPDPDNDFIDLQALITNVALACTRESAALHPEGTAVFSQPPPEHPEGSIGLWRYAEGDGKFKYLVARRDGTIPDWPWFVLGARDLAGIHAMAAYAWYAALLKYPPQFVADCERLAREMAAYLREHGAGDPAAAPHREDDPAIMALMAARLRGDSARITHTFSAEIAKPDQA